MQHFGYARGSVPLGYARGGAPPAKEDVPQTEREHYTDARKQKTSYKIFYFQFSFKKICVYLLQTFTFKAMRNFKFIFYSLIIGILSMAGNVKAENNLLVAFPATATISQSHRTVPTQKHQVHKQKTKKGFFQKVSQKLKTFAKEVKNAASLFFADGQVNIFALLGFIAALLGFLLLIILGFPFFMGTLGLVFGIIGISQINRGNGTGRGFAITAIILGGLIILLAWIVILLIGLVLFAL